MACDLSDWVRHSISGRRRFTEYYVYEPLRVSFTGVNVGKSTSIFWILGIVVASKLQWHHQCAEAVVG